MSDKLSKLHAELTLKIDEIAQICEQFGYAATPTILLRHNDGANYSILLSNDDVPSIVECIISLGCQGKQSDQSAYEAAIELLKG